MSMFADRELTDFRLDHYRLLGGLLAREPTPELLEPIARGAGARAQAAALLHPLLGEGWTAIAGHLREQDCAAVRDEFTRLFLGPYSTVLKPYESYYLTGRLFQEPLVEVRALLAEFGLERDEERFAEPEDVLAFELDVMRWLVERQRGALGRPEETQWLERQSAFLSGHLLVWGPACAQDIAASEGAGFYRGVALLLQGFLAVEREFFSESRAEGGFVVEALEAARRKYGSGTWKGPLFDP